MPIYRRVISYMKQERNAQCACRSGIKYKKCCLITEREQARLAKIELEERRERQWQDMRLKRELELDYTKANPNALRGY